MDQTPFFTAGGTLRQDAPSYVERRADDELYHGLAAGDFCYVLTSRQMGKSSLMVRTAAKLKAEGTAVALLDLTSIGQNLTIEQWYDGLLLQLGEQLGLEEELDDFWCANARIGPLQRWIAALKERVLSRFTGPVIVCVDEIDAVRSLPFSTDEFFAGIRECFNRRSQDPEFRRLTFCLLGTAAPSDLIQDPRTTPFNVGRRIEVVDFDTAQAAGLARGLDRANGDGLVRRALYWTGGHPYLTQRLCRAIAEDPSVTAAAGVDRLCEALFLSTAARERDDNLLFVRERLLREGEIEALLDLYGKVRAGKPVLDDPASPLAARMKLSGIVKVAAGRLAVRNRIYARVFDRRWIAENMPDAELRRQKAAYWRGVARAATLGATVLAVVASLAVAASTQARRAEVARTEAVRQRRIAVADEHQTRRLAANLRETLGSLRLALGDARYQKLAATGQATKARRAEALARTQERAAEAARAESESQRGRAEAQTRVARARTHESLLQKTRAERYAYLADLNLAHHAWEDGNSAQARLLLERHVPGKGQRDLRGFEWRYLWSLSGKEEARATLRPQMPANQQFGAMGISPDGRRMVYCTQNAASTQGSLHLYDFDAKRETPLPAGTVREGQVWKIVFSRDGRRFIALTTTAAGGTVSDAKVLLFDAATGRGIGSWAVHNVTRWQVPAISPDGGLVAVGGSDGTVRLWDVDAGKELPPLTGFDQGSNVAVLAFSRDGRLLTASAASGNLLMFIRQWRMNTREVISAWKVDAAAFAIGWNDAELSPDGRLLGAGRVDGTVKLWDVGTGRELPPLVLHGVAQSIAFSPDGTELAVWSTHNTLTFWDLAARRPIATPHALSQPKQSAGASFTGDGETYVTEVDGTVKLWPAHPKPEGLQGDPGAVSAIAASPDGRLIATANADRIVQVWEVGTGREVVRLTGHKTQIVGVAFSKDGRRLASWSQPDYLSGPIGPPKAAIPAEAKVWDLGAGRAIATVPAGDAAITRATLSPDGRLVAISRDAVTYLRADGTQGFAEPARLEVVDSDTGRTILSRAAGSQWPRASFSKSGRFLAWSETNRVILYDLPARRRTVLRRHYAYVYGLCFSGDGRRLFSVDCSGNAVVWDVPGRRAIGEIRTYSGRDRPGTDEDFPALAHSSASETLALGRDDGAILLCDTRRFRSTGKLQGHTGAVAFLAFSADGRRLASGSADTTVRLWDLTNRQEILNLQGHNAGIAAGIFLPRDRGLLTCSADLPMKLWRADVGEAPVASRPHGTATAAGPPRTPRSAARLVRLPASAAAPRSGGLAARYHRYGNYRLDQNAGPPANPFTGSGREIDRVDPNIAFDWGDGEWGMGIPGVKDAYSNAFEARWTGDIYAPKTGRYHLELEQDDGARLFLDGRRIIDAWGPNEWNVISTADLVLEKGWHAFRLDFWDQGGGANCALFWNDPFGSGLQVIPPKYFGH